ncbi:unnamed protein product [marine sediment metagenome]|uniref:Uncharacterized protein n=1 Tax=marine sediment metagenome TaxID=412755 RepID=X1HY37_9ZZZZ
MGRKKGRKIPSEVIRVNKIQIKKLKEIGKGDHKIGLSKVLNVYEIITQQPEEKLMKHIDNFMVDLKQYYGENHYEHFLNFPAMVRLGLRKGHLDTRILKGRPEKSIDKFMEKKHVEKK